MFDTKCGFCSFGVLVDATAEWNYVSRNECNPAECQLSVKTTVSVAIYF